ncbi:ZIP family metal transporter [Pseudalkalibacillus salsuginis]|uniref:ZIP family metal transporter n=1 Tax=Pseudalkalibacillus salsuginis TaxID=2910972 RepID=UPI001F414410|nr:ZIP family metal transporter [Pseudalkalibacillus salsuginis]MCF6410886.1 ZIP family metal transporter [Pseudalkalibacillus salsuginis]
MWLALTVGAIAGSSVFLGALIGTKFKLHEKNIAMIMAFGAGTLLGAATFELLRESVERGGIFTTTIGFLFGSIVFTSFNLYLYKKGGHKRKSSDRNPPDHSGLAIFFGTLLDAIPESIIIGINILQEGKISWLFLIAVFISNFPEGLSSTIGLKKNGYSHTLILSMWATVFVLTGLSALAGYSLLEDAQPETISIINAFAAGGITAMIVDTMVPEAFKKGGPLVGFIVSLGLLLSLVLILLQ